MKCSESLKDKKIIITGGTGFIGTRVVEDLLKKGAKCFVITRKGLSPKPNLTYIKNDLTIADEATYKNIIEEYGNFDIALYMAANIPVVGQRKENCIEALNSTLVPLVRFAQSMCECVSKFVYTSSVDVIGYPEKSNYSEDTSLLPFTPYGIAKLAGEIYLKSLTAINKTDLTILRFSQVYGPNEPLLRIIPILLNALRNDETFKLYGTGNEKRKFLFVKDASKSVVCALESDSTGIFNIAGASSESILELIEIAQKIYNKKLNITSIEYNGKTFDNIPSIDNAKCYLGFEPDYSLQKGLEEIKNASFKV